MKITGIALKLNQVTRNGTLYTEDSFTNLGDIQIPLLRDFDSNKVVGGVTKIWLDGDNIMFEATIDPSKEEETSQYNIAAPLCLSTNIIHREDDSNVEQLASCFFIAVSLSTTHSQDGCNFTRL